MFERLAGNTFVKTALRRLMESGRVPNSLLFTGIDGIGKKQFAIELARAFVCKDTNGAEPCEICSACKRAGVFAMPKADDKDAHKRVIISEHLDIGIVIPSGRNILVDAIRHLEAEANFRPFEGRARVFIVDDADRMNEAAANALLKTLEEPATTTHLILITSRPDALLPTILSRCQQLRFSPVSEHDIERYLAEHKGYHEHDARLAARFALGSIGRAIEIDLADLKGRRERMLDVLESAAFRGDLVSLLRASEAIADGKEKERFEESLGLLQSLINDAWQIAVGGPAVRSKNPDLADKLTYIAEEAGKDKLAVWNSDIENLRSSLDVNINRRIATDALFTKMAAGN
jgi:DNA polymerase-3 subunit delta'